MNIPKEDKQILVIAAILIALVSFGFVECNYVRDKMRKEKSDVLKTELYEKLDALKNNGLPKINTNIFLSLSNLTILHFHEKEFIHFNKEDWTKLTNHYSNNIISRNVTINFYD